MSNASKAPLRIGIVLLLLVCAAVAWMLSTEPRVPAPVGKEGGTTPDAESPALEAVQRILHENSLFAPDALRLCFELPPPARKYREQYLAAAFKTLDALLASATWDKVDGGFWKLEDDWNAPGKVKDCAENAEMLGLLCRAAREPGGERFGEYAVKCAEFAIANFYEKGEGGFFTQWYPGVNPDSRKYPHVVEPEPTARMVSAMLVAGEALQRKEFTDAAMKSAERILAQFTNEKGDVLYRATEAEALKPRPQLSGATACLEALLAAYEHSQDAKYLARADQLAAKMCDMLEAGAKWEDIFVPDDEILLKSRAALALLRAHDNGAARDKTEAAVRGIVKDIAPKITDATGLEAACAYARLYYALMR